MKRHWKVWIVGLLAVSAVFVTSILLLHRWMDGAAVGRVRVGTPAASTTPPPPTGPVVVKTTYFTTLLPEGFSVKRRVETPDAAQTLSQLVANSPSSQDQQFAASYNVLPGGGLSEIGDYNLRATQTQTYTRFTPPGLPASAVAFRTTTGPAAFTVFWPHGVHYAELAVSTDGNATLEQLQALFSQLISSWQWQ